MPEFKRYQKEFDHSYAFGVFATLELLQWQGQQVIKVLLSSRGERNEGVAKLREQCQRRKIPIEVNDKLVERLSAKESHLAIGVFHKYESRLEEGENHVVLVNPGDMGNLGTISRTMAGYGVRNLGLVRPAVDIFDPRAIRASMGAIFQLRFAYFDSFGDYREAYSGHVYPFMTGGEARLETMQFERPYVLVFGNESSGLEEAYKRYGTSVSIGYSETIDSLNLAVAVGIALYMATRGEFGQ